MTPQGPHIDWAGLSPLLALLGAATLVLLIGLLRPRAVRALLVPALALAGFLAAIGRGGRGAVVLARGGAARGGARRVLRADADLGRRHVGARRRAEPGHAVPRA